ncbi:hypothetical protein [Actinoplanes sp. TFC3]|uniref:hypothetical protein n=1 Tax=Actinoplanes sp. TFC3 TaxID=1710355 RepID=UPI00128FD49C|nr:hypothetical protein [Actinoplanes sp. TFC3]
MPPRRSIGGKTADRRAPAGDTLAGLRDRIRQLELILIVRDRAEHAEITRLRCTVTVLAQHIQALTLEITPSGRAPIATAPSALCRSAGTRERRRPARRPV